LRRFLERMGGKPEVTHPTTTLEERFVRMVRENIGAGQHYTSSDT